MKKLQIEEGTEKDFSVTSSLSKWLQQPGLGEAKAKSLELLHGPHMGGRGPSTCAIFHWLPRCISQEAGSEAGQLQSELVPVWGCQPASQATALFPTSRSASGSSLARGSTPLSEHVIFKTRSPGGPLSPQPAPHISAERGCCFAQPLRLGAKECVPRIATQDFSATRASCP